MAEAEFTLRFLCCVCVCVCARTPTYVCTSPISTCCIHTGSSSTWHFSLVSLHSWAAGDWGACSRLCGGGQQTRTLRCLRKVTYQREEVVAHSLCPVISPAQVQPCHTQVCPPEWSTGSWSQVGLQQHMKTHLLWSFMVPEWWMLLTLATLCLLLWCHRDFGF